MTDGEESRLALDGNWDIGIGVWFEAAAARMCVTETDDRWTRQMTAGADYTFLSGIHVLGEHAIRTAGPTHDRTTEQADVTALSLDRRVGLMDSVQTIIYYDWNQEETYLHAGWARVYDDWRIDVIGFVARNNDVGAFSGSGGHVMATYSY